MSNHDQTGHIYTYDAEGRAASVDGVATYDAQAKREMCMYWDAFADCDPFPDPDGDFADRMMAAGLVELRPVTEEDLDDPFAGERGIEPGGQIYVPTKAGLAALAASAEDFTQ